MRALLSRRKCPGGHAPDATAGCPKPQMSWGQGGRPGWLLGKRQASPHRFVDLMNKDSPCPSSHCIGALSPGAWALHPSSGSDTHGPEAGSLLGLAPRTSPPWCSAGASRTCPRPPDHGAFGLSCSTAVPEAAPAPSAAPWPAPVRVSGRTPDHVFFSTD